MDKTLRLLMAEDSEDDAKLLLLHLKQAGFEPVHERIDTPEAMKAALGHAAWDILISDNSMPRFSPGMALKIVKENGIDLPVIIVSGTIDPDAAVAAMKAGASDFMKKGDLLRLVPAIERELREAKNRQARRAAEEQFRQLQKMEAVGRLAGGVAHDFNNLLTVIMGYAELMLPSFDPKDERREDIAEIVKTADRAARLTRQLLAFSRRQVLEPVGLDLNAVLAEVQSMLRRVIGEDVNLSIVGRSKSPRIKFDPTQMEQVLMNLVINARDAMPKGGKILIETLDSPVDEEFCRTHPGLAPGDYVALIVSDNGSGMDQETLAHIFEPFFTTKEKGKGTGLGLSTVYGIVKQSGGYVKVDSEPGVGTAIKLYLPRTIEATAAPVPPAVSKAPPRGTETILLVEDEEGLRRLADRTLGQAGYQVLAASNGREALDKAAGCKQPIHLLVTDVVMPKLGGGAMAELLGRLHPETKLLFMSGYTDDAIVHHGVLAPGISFLRKPFSPTDLTKKVRETLDAPAAGKVPAAEAERLMTQNGNWDDPAGGNDDEKRIH